MNPTKKLNLLLIIVGLILGALGFSNLLFGWPPFTFTTTTVFPVGDTVYTIDWLYTEPPPPGPGPFDIRPESHPAWAALTAKKEKTQNAIDAIARNVSLPHKEADFTIFPRENDLAPIEVIIIDPENWHDYTQKRNKAAAFFRKYQIDPCDAMIVWMPEDMTLFEQKVGNEPPPGNLKLACGDLPSQASSPPAQ